MADEPDSTAGRDSDATPGESSRSLVSGGVRTVGAWTLLSRLLGMLRDVGMAATFGNGRVLDAFTVAFRVPNLFRRLFGEGALTAAFLPAYVRERETRDLRSASQLATVVFAALAAVLILLVGITEAAIWSALVLLQPSPATALLLELTAVLLPYVVLVCLAAQVSAVLHAHGRFAVPALLPVVLNVVWIVALWVVPARFESPESRVLAISMSIVAAGVLQLLATLPTLFALGYRPDLGLGEARQRLRDLGIAMLPVLAGLALTQLNTLVDSLIAWGFSAPGETLVDGLRVPNPDYPLESGTASALYLGQRMYQFPLGVFGVALGTVLFPLLTRHAERGRLDLVRDDLGLGVRLVLAIGLPASLGLVLLAEPITTLLFRHGEFDAFDASQTAAAIAAYAAGVWAYSGIHVLQRAFYAMDDRVTPMRIGLVAVVVNVGLDFAVLWPLGGPGLAYATAFAAMLHVGLLAYGVQWHVGRLDAKDFGGHALRVVLGTLGMGLCCGATLVVTRHLLPGDEIVSRVARVALPTIVGGGTYLVAARALGLDEVFVLLRRGR